MSRAFQKVLLLATTLFVCIGALIGVVWITKPSGLNAFIFKQDLFQNKPVKSKSFKAPEVIVFTMCEGVEVSGIQSQCGRFYPDPNNAFIYIAFAKLTPISAAKEAAPVVYFSGGPGEGGNTSGAKLEAWRYRMLDWNMQRPLIVWDSRGNIGAWGEFHCAAYQELMLAQLRLSQLRQSEPVATSDTASANDWGLKDEGEVVQSCLQQWHIALKRTDFSQFSSRQSASDILGLLDALQIQQWHALSVSYGSRVAQWLAHLRPEGMLSALFDSPYGWHVQTREARMDRWEHAFERFYQACQQKPDCHQQHDVKALVESSLAKRRQQPLSVRYTLEGRVYRAAIDDIQLRHIVFSDLYWPDQYAPWVRAFAHLEKGDAGPVEALIHPVLETKLSHQAAPWLYWVTECNDNRQRLDGEHETLSTPLAPPHSADRYWQPDTQSHICQLLSADRFLPVQPALDEYLTGHALIAAAFPPPSNPEYPRIVLAGEYDPVVTLNDARQVSGTEGIVFVGHEAGHGLFYGEVCGTDWLAHYWSAPQGFINTLTSDASMLTVNALKNTLKNAPNNESGRLASEFGQCHVQF